MTPPPRSKERGRSGEEEQPRTRARDGAHHCPAAHCQRRGGTGGGESEEGNILPTQDRRWRVRGREYSPHAGPTRR
eukprot:5087531-Pyramimonas_sp.AAC.1